MSSALKKVLYTTTALALLGTATKATTVKTVYDVEVLESHYVSKSNQHNHELWIETPLGGFLFKTPFEVNKGDKISFRVNPFTKNATRLD